MSTGQADPACWLGRVCEHCGAIPDDTRAIRCERCGRPLPHVREHDERGEGDMCKECGCETTSDDE